MEELRNLIDQFEEGLVSTKEFWGKVFLLGAQMVDAYSEEVQEEVERIFGKEGDDDAI